MEAGRELDELIAAKVMLWRPRVVSDRPFSDETFTVYDYERTTDDGRVVTSCWSPGSGPNFSSDIGAAWRVVEKLRGDGLMVQVICHEHPSTEADPAFHVLVIQDGGEAGWNLAHEEWAVTAPLAICAVAIKAVGALT